MISQTQRHARADSSEGVPEERYADCRDERDFHCQGMAGFGVEFVAVAPPRAHAGAACAALVSSSCAGSSC
eukprot:scaffold1661_cov251-Pinguiococcus_pyrenoidosus.AAC.22